MVRRSAEPIAAGRVAILGAATPVGVAVRSALEGQGVPAGRVELFGAVRGEVVLSEYAGEARLIQALDPNEVQEHDVIFVCETGEETEGALAGNDGRALIVDLVGWQGAGEARLVHPRVPRSLPATGGRVAVPHPLAMVLVDLLAPIDADVGLREATAVVLRPAADLGDAGIEELRGQVVSLLNFSELPREVFGGAQLAFNVLPQRCLPGDETGLSRRVSDEAARLLEWPPGRLAVQLLTVPLFHGHGVSLRVVPHRQTTAETLLACLGRRSDLEIPGDATAITPIEVTGERRTAIAEISEDGGSGFWLWAVVGEASAAAAEQAVRLARETGRL